MRRPVSTSAAFSAALALSIFVAPTLGQQRPSSLPNLSSTASQASASSTQASSTPSNTQSGAPTSRSPNASISATGSASSVVISAPSITATGSTASGPPRLTGLPKVEGQYSYPPATVPPTQNAPYMKASRAPEGTVFIAVGSLLAFFAFAVLTWRGMVAWSLRRAIRRAAMNQDMSDTKARFQTPAAPLFKYSDMELSSSQPNLGKDSKKRASNLNLASAAAGNLFFSPTAGAANAGGMPHASNRVSSYLPAGYYAAGAAAPGNGSGMTHVGSTESITLANLRPHSQGYGAGHPGDSPLQPPSLLGAHRLGNQSVSSLDLQGQQTGPRTQGSRAPSAYLEDLFNESAAPHQQGGRF